MPLQGHLCQKSLNTVVWTLNLPLYLLEDDDDDDNDDGAMLSSPAHFSLCMPFFEAFTLIFYSPIFFGEPLKRTAHLAALSCCTRQLHMSPSNHPALLLLMASLCWLGLLTPLHFSPPSSQLSLSSLHCASNLILTLAHWLLVTLHLHSPHDTPTSHPSVSPSFLTADFCLSTRSLYPPQSCLLTHLPPSKKLASFPLSKLSLILFPATPALEVYAD